MIGREVAVVAPFDPFDEDQRHRRRMMLMREMGKTNRMETRMHIAWGVAIFLALIAVVLNAL